MTATPPHPGKPLGGKAYGSTPHIPDSRLGSGDWSVNPGQAAIATTRVRDDQDMVWASEKLDGSCCAVAHLGHLTLRDEGNALTARGRLFAAGEGDGQATEGQNFEEVVRGHGMISRDRIESGLIRPERSDQTRPNQISPFPPGPGPPGRRKR